MEPEKPAKEFIQQALAETGLSLDQLAKKLAYPSLKRASYGEIPLPQSKRAHILDIVALHHAQKAATKIGVEVDAITPGGAVAFYRLPEGASPRAKLRSTLAARGLSIQQLAKLTKYSAAVLEGVVNGTGRISEAMAKTIVRELPELEVEELLSGSDSPRVMDETGTTATHGSEPPFKLPGKTKTRFVPLVSWAAAGRLDEIDATDEAYAHEGVLTNVPGQAFAVVVHGDSMHPEINSGDLAIVRKDASPTPGGLVLVKTINGDVLCKRYQVKRGTGGEKIVVLSSVNPSYQPYELQPSEIAFMYPIKQVTRNY